MVGRVVMRHIAAYTSTPSAEDMAQRVFHVGAWFCGYEKRSPWLRNSPYCPPNVAQWYRVEVLEDREVHCAVANLDGASDVVLGGAASHRNWDSHWRGVWRSTVQAAAESAKSPVSVFVDISSMPRAVYGALLIEAANELRDAIDSLVLGYVPGQHLGSYEGRQQLDGLRALAGLEGLSNFDRDPALVLGLGYDGPLAEAVVDLFQMTHVSCVLADPGVSPDAAAKARVANHRVLERAELVETADVGDLSEWLDSLNRLVSWYSETRDVMLLPLGPKPQVVAGILCALEHPEVALRCLRTSSTRPVDVAARDDEPPRWMEIRMGTS